MNIFFAIGISLMAMVSSAQGLTEPTKLLEFRKTHAQLLQKAKVIPVTKDIFQDEVATNPYPDCDEFEKTYGFIFAEPGPFRSRSVCPPDYSNEYSKWSETRRSGQFNFDNSSFDVIFSFVRKDGGGPHQAYSEKIKNFLNSKTKKRVSRTRVTTSVSEHRFFTAEGFVENGLIEGEQLVLAKVGKMTFMASNQKYNPPFKYHRETLAIDIDPDSFEHYEVKYREDANGSSITYEYGTCHRDEELHAVECPDEKSMKLKSYDFLLKH